MIKEIEPRLKFIGDYLSLQKHQSFVIPEYQRSYSWGNEQCEKLLDDIESFISSGSNDPYFFGTIIVDCSVQDKFNLIDGQQRTITFLLLVKALLLRIHGAIQQMPKDDDSDALKGGLLAKRDKILSILYQAEDEEIPVILKKHLKVEKISIIESKSIMELYPLEVSKIIEGENFGLVEKMVVKIPKRKKSNKYSNHFKNFKYFYDKLGIKSESLLNEFARVFLRKCQIIEIRSWDTEQAITMFNSLNSTGLPLTDADVISAKLFSKAGNSQDKFEEMWGSLIKLSNYLDNKNIVDIDSILQQFMYISRAVNRSYVNGDSVDVTTPGLRRYYTEINKGLLDDPMALCNKLVKIAKLWDEIKDYPTVKLLLKYNENVKLYLSGYLYRFDSNEISEEVIFDVCECLLKLFTVLEVVESGYSSSKFKTFLFKENIKLVDSSISTRVIKFDFDDHIRRNWIENEILELVEDYEGNILVYLNEYLFSKSIGNIFDFDENVNIEHIMPASGRYISSIKQDAGISGTDEFEMMVNKIGNKILLEESVNKALGREWFKTKKQTSVLDRTGYKDSKYSMALSLTSYHKDTWTKEDIEEATVQAAKRITDFIFNT